MKVARTVLRRAALGNRCRLSDTSHECNAVKPIQIWVSDNIKNGEKPPTAALWELWQGWFTY